jgi:hypothetical protein
VARSTARRRAWPSRERESEKRFLDILYASSNAILLIDWSKFVDCNEATARMIGHADRRAFLSSHPSEPSPAAQPDGRGSFEKAEERNSPSRSL